MAIDFGGVRPGTVGPITTGISFSDFPSFSGGILQTIPVDASMTVSITGDTAHFQVRDVFVLEWVTRLIEVDPSELPPGHHGHIPRQSETVQEVVASMEGAGSIAIKGGQQVLVRVQYAALNVEGTFTGTLVLQFDKLDTIQVPLSLFLADIRTAVLDTLNIGQGQQASLPLTVMSLMGPSVDITHEMSPTQLHTGLTILPNKIHLNAKETKNFSLVFLASKDAPLGTNDIAIRQFCFGGMNFFFKANIIRSQIVVNPAQPNNIRSLKRDVVINIAISISLNGGSESQILFSPGALPTGVSMQARGFFVQTDTVVNLNMYLGNQTPDQFQFSINWSASGEQTGVMNFGVTIPRPIVFTAPIETGGLAALGGSVTVTINPDGTTRWQGHAHDSGADGYDFAISALVRSPKTGRAIAFLHTGHVGGTLTSGSRDNDWDELQPPKSLVAQFFDDYADAGHLETHLEYTSNIGSALEGILSWLVKFAVGTALGPIVGSVVFVGIELGSLASTGSLVPGARIVEGILWMAGPENTLFAIIAEGIASVGSRTREIEQEWYDWANGIKEDADPRKADAQVFAGSLPPRENLVLADTIGPDNRAFTFPRWDGKIVLNMGPDAFDDPRNYEIDKGRRWGEVFIHELVHACQIQHSGQLSLFADALSNKLCEASGGNPYNYGTPDQDYTELNYEQQAQIVQDWFSGKKTVFGQTGIPKDRNSPYFRYIVDNVRTGKF